MCAFLSVCALLHSSILVIVVDTFVHSNQFCVCISHFTSSFVFVYECLWVFARVCARVCLCMCFNLFSIILFIFIIFAIFFHLFIFVTIFHCSNSFYFGYCLFWNLVMLRMHHIFSPAAVLHSKYPAQAIAHAIREKYTHRLHI